MYRQRYPDDPGMHNSTQQQRRGDRSPSRGFCQQLCGGMVISLLGLILIFCSQLLLGWNESRAVQTARSLDEGLGSVIELHSPDIAVQHDDGKLVHLHGMLACDQIVNDPAYGLALPVVRLRRKVEMFQWVEIETTEETQLSNGETETKRLYSYDMKWMSHHVSSSGFDSHVIHRNPSAMPAEPETFSTSMVRVGTFKLSQNLLNAVSSYKDFYPNVLPEGMTRIEGKFLYNSEHPNNPKVGDYRISFSYAGLCKDGHLGRPDEVSIIAKQDGTELSGYETIAGDVLEMLSMGQKSSKEMFTSAKASNTMYTWAIRCAGLLMSFCGFTCLTNLILVVVGYIPIVREIITVGVVTMNISLSVSVSLFTIAISWIIFRPWFAVILLAAALIPYLGPNMRHYSRASSQGNPYTPPPAYDDLYRRNL